jgi:hypothetical protein
MICESFDFREHLLKVHFPMDLSEMVRLLLVEFLLDHLVQHIYLLESLLYFLIRQVIFQRHIP